MNETDERRLEELLDLVRDCVQKAQPSTKVELTVRIDRHGHVDLDASPVRTEIRV